MSNLGRVFALTKSEQRMAILIVALLVGFAFAKRQYEQRHFAPKPQKSPATAETSRSR